MKTRNKKTNEAPAKQKVSVAKLFFLKIKPFPLKKSFTKRTYLFFF